jgi:hypothetical protein
VSSLNTTVRAPTSSLRQKLNVLALLLHIPIRALTPLPTGVMPQMLWVAANITLKRREPAILPTVSMLALLDGTLVAPWLELGVPSLLVCAMTPMSMLLSRLWVPPLWTYSFPLSTQPQPERTTLALTHPRTPRHAEFTTWALQRPRPPTALTDLFLVGRTAGEFTRKICVILLVTLVVLGQMHHGSGLTERRVLLPLVAWQRLVLLGLLAGLAIPWSVVSTTRPSLRVI